MVIFKLDFKSLKDKRSNSVLLHLKSRAKREMEGKGMQ